MSARKWFLGLPAILLGGLALVVGLVPGTRNWIDQAFPVLGINGPSSTIAKSNNTLESTVTTPSSPLAESTSGSIENRGPLVSIEAPPVYQQPTDVQFAQATFPVQNPSARIAQAPQFPSLPPSGIQVPSSNSRGVCIVNSAQITFPLDIKVSAQSEGIITELEVDDGAMVTNGNPMISIDARIAMAEAEVAKQKMLAAEIKAKDVSNVKYAEAAFEVAKIDLEISNSLVVKESESQMDNRKKQLEYTKAKLQIGVANSEKAQQAAEVAVTEAQLGAATVQIALRTINAPFDGVVTEVAKRRYSFVRPGDIILRLTSMENIRVQGNVTPDVAPHLLLNAPARVTIDVPGMQEKPVVEGRVSHISPRSLGINSYPVHVDIKNQKTADGQFIFREGMIATIEIMHGQK